MSQLRVLQPDLHSLEEDGLALFYISGQLDDGTAGNAYEGRLQTHNGEGFIKVRQTGGDELPPGHQLYVDQTTKEIVVAWPNYAENVALIENGGFETGTTAAWTFENLGGLGTPVVDSQYHYEGAHALRWPAQKGVGLGGGVELYATNSTIGDVYPGKSVIGSLRFMYNPERINYGHGNVEFRGRAYLVWLDENGAEISRSLGRLEKGGHRRYAEWMRLPVIAKAPAGAFKVKLGGMLSNVGSDGWLDDAQWDVPTSVGDNVGGTYCVSLQATDARRRTAEWSGCVRVSGIRMAYVADIVTLPRWWKINTDYTVDGPFALPAQFTAPVQMWKRVGDRLYAGNATNGTWFSEDPDLAVWTQCTGIIASLTPGNIVRTPAGWVLIYAKGTPNTSYSFSTDGVSFSTLTTSGSFNSSTRAPLAVRGSTVITSLANSPSARVSTDGGATFSTVTVSGGGLVTDDFLAADDGFYRCGSGTPLNIRHSPTATDSWTAVTTGLDLSVASGVFGVELEGSKVAIMTRVSNTSQIGTNVAIGNLKDGWTTATITPPIQFSGASTARSMVAFNLDSILVGGGGYGLVRWIKRSLQEHGSITMPEAVQSTRVTVTS